MKKGVIKNLLKKIQLDLDSKKNELFQRESTLGELLKKLQSSYEKICQEKEFAKELLNTRGFSEFLNFEKIKQNEIQINIKKTEIEVENFYNELREIFSEQKKYEYIAKNIELEEGKSQERVEREILDNFKNGSVV